MGRLVCRERKREKGGEMSIETLNDETIGESTRHYSAFTW